MLRLLAPVAALGLIASPALAAITAKVPATKHAAAKPAKAKKVTKTAAKTDTKTKAK